jgi:hypothetical protein
MPASYFELDFDLGGHDDAPRDSAVAYGRVTSGHRVYGRATQGIRAAADFMECQSL